MSDHIEALLQDVATIKNEIKWQRWALGVLAAAVVSPKLGGPDATEIAIYLMPGI